MYKTVSKSKSNVYPVVKDDSDVDYVNEKYESNKFDKSDKNGIHKVNLPKYKKSNLNNV